MEFSGNGGRLQPENPVGSTHAGLYIHVPFCHRKCVYCDFYSITDLSWIGPYVQGLQEETALVDTDGLNFDSVYLGGGTPSILEADQLETILTAVFERFRLSARSEVSLEANPGTITRDRAVGWVACGVNRLNIGVQSFDDERLAFLRRLHSAKQAHHAICSARAAGVDNLGLDLIYGLPGQSPEQWLDDLKEAVRYRPEHLSCYMLTYEPGTPLKRLVRQGRVSPLEEGRVRALFDLTADFLSEAGYEQYEISNFSRGKAFRCRHNRKYWDHAPYIGLGPSAHSFRDNKRCWNHGSLERYLADLARDRLPVEGRETLGRCESMLEAVYLGLRTSNGVRLEAFNRRFGVGFYAYFSGALKALERRGMKGLIACLPDRCILTAEGRAFADAVAAVFAEHIADVPGPDQVRCTTPMRPLGRNMMINSRMNP